MARMGFKKIDNKDMLNLLIIPVTGIETGAVFSLIHADNYPIEIKGRIEFDGDSSPQIILYGNNVVVKETYETHLTCSNCGSSQKCIIQKGLTKRDTKSETVCSHCGCYLTGDPNFRRK